MDRLSHEQFIPDSQFRIYRQILHENVESHWHEFFEMGFILAGEGEHIYNGTSYPLTRGSLFLLTPTDIHALYLKPDRPLELFNVIFSEAMMGEEVGRLLFRGLQDHHIQFENEECVRTEQDFRRLWSEVQHQQVGNQLAIHSTLQRLLIDVARRVPPSNAPKPDPFAQQLKLQKALIYLHHHYREPITLQLIAEQVALSPNYFSECFRSSTGVTFQKYLQSLRLRFAKSLLSVSTLPITDICYAAGFQTLSHFERAFKREFGRSPTAWRTIVATNNHHAPNGSI